MNQKQVVKEITFCVVSDQCFEALGSKDRHQINGWQLSLLFCLSKFSWHSQRMEKLENKRNVAPVLFCAEATIYCTPHTTLYIPAVQHSVLAKLVVAQGLPK